MHPVYISFEGSRQITCALSLTEDGGAIRFHFPPSSDLGQVLLQSNLRAVRAQAHCAALARRYFDKPEDFPVVPVPTPRHALPKRGKGRALKWVQDLCKEIAG